MRRLIHGFRALVRTLQRSREFSSPIRYVACFFLTRLRLNERIVFEYHGARFRLWNNPVSCYMYFHNSERWLGTADILLAKRLLRPGDVVVDIGANVGSHCITLGKYLGETSHVYAFEPHPKTFHFLKENLQLNALTNVHIYNCALGETEGEIYFTDEHNDNTNRVVLEKVFDEGVLRVPVRRLDSFEFAQSPITLIKIDVEGYELFVLRGAQTALSNAQFLHFEAYEPHFKEYGYSLAEFVEFLDAHGWRVYRILNNQYLQRVNPSAPLYEEEIRNWIAAKSEDFLIERSGLKILEKA